MVLTGSVQDALDLVDLTGSPLGVCWTSILSNGVEDAEKTESDNTLLVDDVVLVAQGVDGQGSSGREDGGLRDQRVTGERVEDRLRLLLGFLGGDI